MSFKKEIVKHLAFCDNYLDFKSFTNKTLNEWFEPLLDSFSDDGSLSYLIDEKGRYRASPLASTIEWLNEADLLPLNSLAVLQNRLLFLRDNNEKNDPVECNQKKYTEDDNGWSLGEGVSVWSTSVAIIALLDKQKNWLNNIDEIKKSILWLCNQQNPSSGGWAYQNIENCDVNVVCTALALRAISKAMQNYAELLFDDEQKNKLTSALNMGLSYLKNGIVVSKKRYVYWEHLKEPSCVATTWSLLAFYEAQKLEAGLVNDETRKFFYEIKKKSIAFIISRMPKKMEKWGDEQIVYEAGAKYNKQKNYYSFSATLLPQLFLLGLSPYHPQVINQIKWIVENPLEWKITNYDKSSVCSFTYAMILSTLAQWANSVGKVNSVLLLKSPIRKSEKILKLIFGYNIASDLPLQVILKQRLCVGMLSIGIIIFLVIFGESIYLSIKRLVTYLILLFHEESNSIAVNVISSFIYLILVTIPVWIYKLTKNLLRR